MAANNRPIFGLTPKIIQARVAAANTNLDGTGTIVKFQTMPGVDFQVGADGGYLADLQVLGEVTSTAKRINLWLSANGTVWHLYRSGLMAAYTVANTTNQTPVSFIDPTNPDAAIQLEVGCYLGLTSMVNEAIKATGRVINY